MQTAVRNPALSADVLRQHNPTSRHGTFMS